MKTSSGSCDQLRTQGFELTLVARNARKYRVIFPDFKLSRAPHVSDNDALPDTISTRDPKHAWWSKN